MIAGEFSVRPVLVVVLVGFDECDDEANGTRWEGGSPRKISPLDDQLVAVVARVVVCLIGYDLMDHTITRRCEQRAAQG
jgi:hypothetical protein